MLDTTSPRRVRLLTAGVLVATFALGVVTGGGLSKLFFAERFEHNAHDLPRGPWPLRELDLSDEQRAQIEQIFERHRPKLDGVLRESSPLVRSIHEEIDREIRDVLTPEQRVEFDRLKEHRPFPPPGLPPPPGAGPPPGGPPPGAGPGPGGPSVLP
jgi:Spy/CpxP family protein refolding chaperone